MAEIKSLLDEVIEAEIAYVGSLSPEDEKKSKAIQHLADLHKLRIDEIKAKTDADEKRLRRAMDSKQHRAELTLKERQADGDEAARANEEQFKQHQLNDQVLDRYCFVGQVTAKRGCEVFQPSSRKASCNYVVGYDGSIGLCVEEKDRSWCSGGADKKGNPIRVNGISGSSNDYQAVTIEVASDTKHPYTITDKAMAALIELCADICRRNGIKQLLWKGDKKLVGKVAQQNLTVHRWFANKACPGDYIYECLGDIAAKVNAKLGVSSAPSTPAISESKVPYKVRITATDLRIRKGPGTNTAIVQKAIAPGVYTIVSEATGEGATKWGKLKSGVGWVSLDFCKKL